MATKANTGGPHGMHQHTAGIFADMTVDGPEIGTLVVIVDRAKNLPNRKTMGKQNPFCAARLGKDAKKTETDKRGGQTPKWDQELRFTVHDSPDYHSLKVSIFSEDKRTDLIGEGLVDLTEILKQGGGQGDIWKGLTCKGKYAGEVRIEMTYYDTRPKPDKPAEEGATGKVKRRPLPSNPNGPRGINTDAIPGPREPVRARHGPRDYSNPPRHNSLPPESINYAAVEHGYTNQLPASHGHHGEPQAQPLIHEEPQELEAPTPADQNVHSQPPQPDFLPELPPSNRQRGSLPPDPRHAPRQSQPSLPPARPLPQASLLHSHSAPIVPHAQMENGYNEVSQLRTDYPEPIPDLDYQHQNLRQRRNDVPPGWENPYENAPPGRQPYLEDEDEPPPPPPPVHSNSAPEVPQYHTPASQHQVSPASNRGYGTPNGRQPYGQNGSPRGYPSQQFAPHVRSQPGDDYHTPPYQQSIDGMPLSLVPGQPSPQQVTPPSARQMPHRHSVAEPYGMTPPRPHPLSQEVARARSPNPFGGNPYGGSNYFAPPVDMYQQPQYPAASNLREPQQPVMPRTISPRPSQPALRPSSSRNPYTLRHPVQAHESSDGSPLSTSRPDPRMAQAGMGAISPRKSVSPQPSPTSSSTPFSPDSFDVHNPSARNPAPTGPPRNPYRDAPSTADSRQQPDGSIVGWDGREIDPSDHLPIDSWAPEPEKKTPTKTYGLGRDRDFGPRNTPGATPPGGSGGKTLSRDTKINVRMRSAQAVTPESAAARNRIATQANGTPDRSPGIGGGGGGIPSIPNPYAQEGYSPSARFRDSSPGMGGRSPYQNPYNGRAYGEGGGPSLPPKLPLQHRQSQQQLGLAQGYGGGFGGGRYEGYNGSGEDALAQEIGSIDLGPSSVAGGRGGRSLPAPTAYVPVRSHRDRSFY